MSATNFLSRNILNALFGRSGNDFGGFVNAPDLHLAASTTTPTNAGGNFTEPGAGVGYDRLDLVAGSFDDATLADPSVLDNSSALTFASATGAGWGTITHVGIFDDTLANGGDLLIFYALVTPRTINDGDTLSFAAGEFDTTLT